MSESAKVVPIDRSRRRRKGGSGSLPDGREAAPATSARGDDDPGTGGLLEAVLRLAGEGARALSIGSLARLQRVAYFAWHSERTDDFGADARYVEALDPVLEFLYALWWRVETTGLEHVPATGPALVVANHSGVLPYDALMVQVAIRHEHEAKRLCRMLALDMFALLPFLAPALARSGSVRANPENAMRLLRRGELLGVFPEGVKGVGKRFKDRYRLARFGRGGYVRVALRTGAPIVPCAIVGAEEIHPVIGKADWVGRPFGLPYFPLTPTFPWLGPLGVVPFPSKWSIDFGAPIDLAEHGPEAADDPILVNRLSEEVRATVQAMVDARLAKRRSVWLG